ncbi:MAG: SDR family oxidoreductase [Deltaproteobacteria bacterium]|nr:SDR family oxidoreductase [Deltaproteobacteria bacterium]
MNWYKGKKVLVTGGSSGIGKAAAIHLAGWGADILLVARGRDRLATFGDPRYGGLDQAAEEVGRVGTGGRIETLSLDVTDRPAVRAAVPVAIELLGGLDVLIHCAGIARPGPILELTDEIFDQTMLVNYTGTVNMVRAFLPHFLAQKKGRIAMVSSLAGLVGVFGYAAYAPSKFAVAGFGDVLRQELLDTGVGVTVVYPPDTDTPQHTEEVPFLPPETKAIAATAKLMAPEAVALEMLRGIASGTFHVVPGFQNRFIVGLYGMAPFLVRSILDGSARKGRGKP